VIDVMALLKKSVGRPHGQTCHKARHAAHQEAVVLRWAECAIAAGRLILATEGNARRLMMSCSNIQYGHNDHSARLTQF